jgi:hypothetical protein
MPEASVATFRQTLTGTTSPSGFIRVVPKFQRHCKVGKPCEFSEIQLEPNFSLGQIFTEDYHFFQTFFQTPWKFPKSLKTFGKFGKKFGKTFQKFCPLELLF